jgi:hypothetical protein
MMIMSLGNIYIDKFTVYYCNSIMLRQLSVNANIAELYNDG